MTTRKLTEETHSGNYTLRAITHAFVVVLYPFTMVMGDLVMGEGRSTLLALVQYIGNCLFYYAFPQGLLQLPVT